jgi:hypothetical protein
LASKGGVARLSAKVLEGCYGTRGWGSIRSLLEANGLLQVGVSYMSNGGAGFCKEYRFGSVCTGEVVNYPSTWVPGRSRRRKKIEVAIRNMSPAQLYVVSWLKRLTVADGWASDPELPPEARKALSAVVSGRWFYSPDKNGRLHHNFANLKASARPYLRLDGVPLVGCDYSSLHPNLILSMATDRTERARLAKALEGDFYSTLVGCTTKDERDRAKEEFNSGVNDRNHRRHKYPAWVAFIREYPNTAAQVMALKANDHRNAACVLQRMESRLIFSEVMAALEKQGVPAISLHDAVFTTPANEEAVRSAMMAAAQRSLGICIRA